VINTAAKTAEHQQARAGGEGQATGGDRKQQVERQGQGQGPERRHQQRHHGEHHQLAAVQALLLQGRLLASELQLPRRPFLVAQPTAMAAGLIQLQFLLQSSAWGERHGGLRGRAGWEGAQLGRIGRKDWIAGVWPSLGKAPIPHSGEPNHRAGGGKNGAGR
jgi:hypothetical protein